MQKNLPFKTLLFLVILASLCLLTALPSHIPIKFSWNYWPKSFSVDTELLRPPLDLRAIGIPFYRDLELKMGLDIQGGTRVTLEAQMENIPTEDRVTALESAREVIARRVDLYGVSEASVKTALAQDQFRIIAELPGVTNASDAAVLIGTTAQLEFREESTDEAVLAQAQDSPFGPYVSTGLTGKDLKRAGIQFSSQTGAPVVTLEFNDEGKKKFGEITQRNIGKRVGIFLDAQPVTLPQVNEPIYGGTAEISGDFTADSAKQLSIQLNAGALPVPIQVVEQETIGASLGQQAVEQTARAGLVGITLVAFFMVLLYGWKGVLANIALGMYALITIAIYKILPITLTLPGIAGMLLSIGMAVDSNILIFERMKEELRMGKPFDLAMRLGFGRAWDSIKDANVVTLFISFILFNPFELSFLNRSGMVRGFALTLALGILVGLFTGIVVTRTLLRVFLTNPSENQPKGKR
jgi:preprotein translocase subunit SecD